MLVEFGLHELLGLREASPDSGWLLRHACPQGVLLTIGQLDPQNVIVLFQRGQVNDLPLQLHVVSVKVSVVLLQMNPLRLLLVYYQRELPNLGL